MHKSKLFKLCPALTLLTLGSLLPLTAAAAGGNVSGTLRGEVLLPDGGEGAGIRVTIADDESGLVREVTTNSDGEFRATLPPGTYSATASDASYGTIEIDSETTLTGLPPRAWDYRLGNRSGLDWVLDQHREKKVRDATVEAWLQKNPDCRYRLADHKERVIDLLARVARVSVETLDIVEELRAASTVGAD